MKMPQEYVDKMNANMLEKIREHAYEVVSSEHVLTILPTEHGARVPPHWINETDRKIASVLPSVTLIEELISRGYTVELS